LTNVPVNIDMQEVALDFINACENAHSIWHVLNSHLKIFTDLN